jgi:hypothetical protein
MGSRDLFPKIILVMAASRPSVSVLCLAKVPVWHRRRRRDRATPLTPILPRDHSDAAIDPLPFVIGSQCSLAALAGLVKSNI